MKTATPFRWIRLALSATTLLAFSACSKHADHSAASHDQAGEHKHEHNAPHGGTPVVLGDEAFHLELVLHAVDGRIAAYVLDAHMENFVRLPLEGFEVVAAVSGKTEHLAFAATGNVATGETIGDTAEFNAFAEWLKTAKEFDATIRSITVRGTTFTDVKFKFPEGNEEH